MGFMRSLMPNGNSSSAILALPQRLLGSTDNEAYRRVLTLAWPAVGEQLLNMTVGLWTRSSSATWGRGRGRRRPGEPGRPAGNGLFCFGRRGRYGARRPAYRRARAGSGAGDLHQGYLIGVVVGLFTMALGISLAVPTMQVLQSPPEVIEYGATYLRIVSLTFLLAAWLFIGNAALRGSGDTRTPMLVMLAVNVVNIVVAQ